MAVKLGLMRAESKKKFFLYWTGRKLFNGAACKLEAELLRKKDFNATQHK